MGRVYDEPDLEASILQIWNRPVKKHLHDNFRYSHFREIRQESFQPYMFAPTVVFNDDMKVRCIGANVQVWDNDRVSYPPYWADNYYSTSIFIFTARNGNYTVRQQPIGREEVYKKAVEFAKERCPSNPEIMEVAINGPMLHESKHPDAKDRTHVHIMDSRVIGYRADLYTHTDNEMIIAFRKAEAEGQFSFAR